MKKLMYFLLTIAFVSCTSSDDNELSDRVYLETGVPYYFTTIIANPQYKFTQEIVFTDNGNNELVVKDFKSGEVFGNIPYYISDNKIKYGIEFNNTMLEVFENEKKPVENTIKAFEKSIQADLEAYENLIENDRFDEASIIEYRIKRNTEAKNEQMEYLEWLNSYFVKQLPNGNNCDIMLSDSGYRMIFKEKEYRFNKEKY